ncbi:MAG: hypothetical protein PW788_11500 [Micavibrio sp.]|nr:hypothetical protein [Micavibrio sp.]
MKKANIIELKMSPVGPFYTYNDEAAFFGWLDKITCIKGYEGIGTTLFIHVYASRVNMPQLLELIGVFIRYEIDCKQLAVFDNPKLKGKFRNRKAYWYKHVFGKKSSKKSNKKPR